MAWSSRIAWWSRGSSSRGRSTRLAIGRGPSASRTAATSAGSAASHWPGSDGITAPSRASPVQPRHDRILIARECLVLHDQQDADLGLV